MEQERQQKGKAKRIKKTLNCVHKQELSKTWLAAEGAKEIHFEAEKSDFCCCLPLAFEFIFMLETIFLLLDLALSFGLLLAEAAFCFAPLLLVPPPCSRTENMHL